MEVKYRPPGLLRLFTAAVMDGIAIVLVALILSRGPGVFLALRSVAMLRTVDGGQFWRGPIPMIVSAAGGFFFVVPFATVILGIVDIAVAASPGQLIAGIGVYRVQRSYLDIEGNSRKGYKGFSRALVVRTVAKRAPAIVIVLAQATVLGVLACAGLVLWFLALLGRLQVIVPPHLTWHDRFAGTALYCLPR